MASMSSYLNKQLSRKWCLNFLIFPGLIILGLLAACGERTSEHGHIINSSELNSIKIGETTRTDIINILGQPSFNGAFDTKTLYYSSQRMEEPVAGIKTTKTRNLYVFRVDNDDKLTEFNIIDENSGVKVTHIDEKTPTPGSSFGVFEQMFLNVKRRQGKN